MYLDVIVSETFLFLCCAVLRAALVPSASGVMQTVGSSSGP
jgi:hypothetical protein